MPSSSTLLDRWLAALRASTTFAHGRECDYARSEGDVDTFDPIGLLALAAGLHADSIVWQHTLGQAVTPFVAPGAWLSRPVAHSLALEVGLDPKWLPDLCDLNDAGCTGGEMADWVAERAR